MTASSRIVRRPDVGAVGAPRPALGGEQHASRRLQARLLADDADHAAAAELIASYRQMAAEWGAWAEQFGDYALPVAAGLGYARPQPVAVELCCGSGQATAELVRAGYRVLALDSSLAMLAAVPPAPAVGRVAADVRRLPLADASCPLVVGLNAVLVPAEVRRVLSPDGQLLWGCSFGPGTPLYVAPEELLDHLGSGWVGQYGRAGRGEWVLAERST